MQKPAADAGRSSQAPFERGEHGPQFELIDVSCGPPLECEDHGPAPQLRVNGFPWPHARVHEGPGAEPHVAALVVGMPYVLENKQLLNREATRGLFLA